MNFLAHAYLSGNDDLLMTGNFIGDFVKGKQLNDFPDPIKKGIVLHRMIDEFTDTHDVVRQSKDRLWTKYRHYSSVIIDVFYDHFLASNWSEFHDTRLEDYVQNVYSVVSDQSAVLPKGVKYVLPYMIEGNWLLNYAKIEGINRALTGMSKRTRFDSKMEEATKDLRENYTGLKEEFLLFFPDVVKFSKEFIDGGG